ncbi:unnamed protein product [Bursaphelenchus okinawaensis]|uniref:Uncharacterized protein n=1 Tax=Bursaphelenchus okinawaensis TaxID=465554 RepID=A0A811KIH6_9BILA|nr:unnamed protein product [Bursaphelenchus okinawaensis]CAG9103427.1 unnamed protein product [Bursaphelenchus okinawaensis]
MDVLYKVRNRIVFGRVLKHVTDVEDLCSFAQTTSYFYKITNMDFKKLCYKNVIFRMKGETWATAFSKLQSSFVDQPRL